MHALPEVVKVVTAPPVVQPVMHESVASLPPQATGTKPPV